MNLPNGIKAIFFDLDGTLRHSVPSSDEIMNEYLRGLGVPPGPVYRRVLGELMDAKLDGKVPGREDEERFVREWLGREGLLGTE